MKSYLMCCFGLMMFVAGWGARPAVAAELPPSSGASLLANGDFETDANGDGMPDGWLKKNASDMSCPSEDGNRFLRLHSTAPGESVMMYKTIPLKPEDKALELSFRARYRNIKAGSKPWYDGRIMMNFKDARKNVVKPGPPPPYFRGTSKDWRQRSVKFLVPEGAVMLEFMPALFQAKEGTLDLDDIRLTALSETEAAAMAAESAAAARKKAEQTAVLDRDTALPPITPELKVSGNKLVAADGKIVWLQGLSVDSMEWGPGENVLWSIRVALDGWKANVIRLAVKDSYWFGKDSEQVPDTEGYRQLLDKAVKLTAGRGAYLVIDLHRFGSPMPEHVEFWKDVGARYKNNPAVLYEVFNEAHGISWEMWRDGGSLTGPGNKHTDVNPAENAEKAGGSSSVGMQAIVDAIRGVGANNIIVVGGLDWAYDLSGVAGDYALEERGGNGIMYCSHIYPWKTDWQAKVLAAAEKYPVIITEVGCPPDYSGFQFIPPEGRHSLEGWAEDVLGLMQKHKLNWTGFSFHPRCGPMVISDWEYTPTPYWGVFVKDALSGKQFDLKKMR